MNARTPPPRLLDPKNDLTFKRVFGEHKHLCMSLLNSLLPLEKPIARLEYQTNEMVSELPDTMRHSIVDVRCVDEDGRAFIVEMQMYWTSSFTSRVLFSASKAYVMQLEKGDDFKLLQPVYTLSFVNAIYEASPEKREAYYHHYKIVNIKDTEKQIKGLEFVFIELPKFKPQNRAEKKLHELWLRFLTEINERTEEVPRELLANELTREAVEYMEVGAYSKEQLMKYDQAKLDVMTARGIINDALEKGEAIGLERGEAIGLERGLAVAVLLGAKAGLPVEAIAVETGLTVGQVSNVLNKGTP